jgi:hypothetical protein
MIRLAVMVVGLIYYVTTRRIVLSVRSVAKAVDELHRELFMMDKRSSRA